MRDLRSRLLMLGVDVQAPNHCSTIVRSSRLARSALHHALSQRARLNRRLRTASKQQFAFPFRQIQVPQIGGGFSRQLMTVNRPAGTERAVGVSFGRPLPGNQSFIRT